MFHEGRASDFLKTNQNHDMMAEITSMYNITHDEHAVKEKNRTRCNQTVPIPHEHRRPLRLGSLRPTKRGHLVEVAAPSPFGEVWRYMTPGNHVAKGGITITNKMTRNSMITNGIEA